MASLRTLMFRFSNVVNSKLTCRSKTINERLYSVFPSYYVQPVVNKDVIRDMEAAGETNEMAHLNIKPAFCSETSSEFYDPLVNKFINFLTKEGNKQRARELLEKTFEKIKRIQLERYHKSNATEQEEIELDPKVILYKAVDNSTPVLELMKMNRGGQSYQVPVPVTEKRARFLAMNWLINAGKEKDYKVKLPERLAYELIDAYNNQGRVIRKKQELYRQCEANRSYAHFRWT
ncbi:hypothetical protein TSAR_009634 [Trichomalopsis sarcophagae]|uniref:Small ribosomal subunit protein uS7 domain-containing protein n=1 Tax=Trichomalopsis sarcophagae TaxID=543379 RepID=A0A232FCL2_9HYME|nr:hypothetical protein TSAR_009634 [Trichomalopsis sarcophagae]